MANETTRFYIDIDEDVVKAATAGATLHGVSIQIIVEQLVTTTLTEYAEKVRAAIPKPEIPGVELTEDDIRF